MKKIINFLKRLFGRLKHLAQQFVTPSIQVVETLKRFVDSPAAPIITAIIPSNLDNKIHLALKRNLPKVIQILRISDECLKLTNADEIILCAITKLKEYEPEGRAAAYHSIAAMLAHFASDKKISWSEAVQLSEMMYLEKHKNDGND